VPPRISPAELASTRRKLRSQTARVETELRVRLSAEFARIIRREVLRAVQLKGISKIRKAITSDDEDSIWKLIEDANIQVFTEARRDFTSGFRIGVVRRDTKRDTMLAAKEVKIREFLYEARIDLADRVRHVISTASETATIDETARRLFTSLRDHGTFSRARAEVIARTETAQAENFGIVTGLSDSGFEMLEWISIRDDRVRPDHEAMHGVRAKIGEPFTLPDGTELEFPAHFDGPPEHVINCRCTVAPVVE